MPVTGFKQTIGASHRMQKQDAFNGVRTGDGMTHGTRRFLVIEKPIALC
jgi:hypothetical protein